MNYKVSVIVPVYNTGFYLTNCIESILQQSYKNIELLLINDGSTDESGEICDEFAIKDARVKVMHQKNKGMSNARNRGIQAATGDYYSFVDSDDWIDSEMIKTLLNISISEEADITMSALRYKSEFKNEIVSFPWEDNKTFFKEDIKSEFLLYIISGINNSGKRIGGSVCKCLFKSTLLKPNKVYFNEKLKSGEDKEFIIRALLNSNTLITTNMAFYHYNRRIKQGGSSTQRYSNDLYENVKYRQQCYIDSLEYHKLLDIHEEGLKIIWIESIIAVIDNLCFKGNSDNIFKILKKAKYILNDSEFNLEFSRISEKNKSFMNEKGIFMLRKFLTIYIITKKIKVNIKHSIIRRRYKERRAT